MEGTIEELRKRYLATETLTRPFADELKKNHHQPEFIAAAMVNVAAEIMRDYRIVPMDPNEIGRSTADQ